MANRCPYRSLCSMLAGWLARGSRILGQAKVQGNTLGLGPYIYQLAGSRLQTDSLSATRCRHANPQGLSPAITPRSLVAPEGPADSGLASSSGSSLRFKSRATIPYPARHACRSSYLPFRSLLHLSAQSNMLDPHPNTRDHIVVR